MSLAYGAITRRRVESRPDGAGSTRRLTGAPEDAPAPVGKPTLDVFAALVPAEVLVAHATIIQVTTETTGDDFSITSPEVLEFSFWALTAASLILYVISKMGAWEPLDIVRMVIPPLAFVGWTMIQPNTAFDAVFGEGDDAWRIALPVIFGLVLGAVAAKLAYKADTTNVSK